MLHRKTDEHVERDTAVARDTRFCGFWRDGGIGSALCHQLRDDGASVYGYGRNRHKLDALSEYGVEAASIEATDLDAVDTALDDVLTKHGSVDGIACCVGSLLLKPAHTTTPDEWAAVLSTNLTSAFAVVRAGARVMRATGGSIVLCSSAAARHGFANHEAIAAAKGGVTGLMLAAAASYARRGIRINAVAPGLVQTPMTAHLTTSDRAREASIEMHPLKRLGTSGDVASVIRMLLQPESRWITGQTLGVDGGLSTLRPQS